MKKHQNCCIQAVLLQGFTLIELLVVVLSIGILAAVALPQYQKAVLKSRFASIKSLTRSIANAQELYYLANGEYTLELDKLDIELPTPTSSTPTATTNTYFYPWGFCLVENNSNKLVYCILSKAPNPTSNALSERVIGYWISLIHNGNNAGKTACYAYGSDANSMQNKICQNETKKATRDAGGTSLSQWLY